MNDRNPLSLLLRRWERRVPLSESDKEQVLALPHQVRSLPRDSYLVREGDPTSTCSLLLDGFAFRQKLVSSGARQIISFHIPGEFVDLQNILLNDADHNVQTLTRVEVATVSKAALLVASSASERVQQAIWLDTLIDSSVFREWVVNVGRRDAKSRVAHLLCELVVRMRSAGLVEGYACDFPITQEQLADATGLTAVHTNRTLQALRKQGLIQLSSNRLTGTDWSRLAQLGDFSERYLHHGV